MSRKFVNLGDLLQSEEKARAFFTTLPDYVQGGVTQHAFAIHSFESLKDCADTVRRSVE